MDLWKLVIKDKATWRELNEYYSWEDAQKMIAVLDMTDDIQTALTPPQPKE